MQHPLTTDERLRRCLLLCCHFAANVAYYRARRSGGAVAYPSEEFWDRADANFIDTAVLEWCKMFGDGNAKHSWQKNVNDPSTFERDMLADLSMTSADLRAMVSEFRHYRDKFIAHLDSERIMTPPYLDGALRAACFYYRHIWSSEIDPLCRGNAPADLERFYRARLAAGVAIYHP